MTEKLTNWKARRAGGRITITGKDALGGDLKIVGVDEIVAGKNGKPPIATDQHGETWELV